MDSYAIPRGSEHKGVDDVERALRVYSERVA